MSGEVSALITAFEAFVDDPSDLEACDEPTLKRLSALSEQFDRIMRHFYGRYDNPFGLQSR
jgi:hypothetical protein